MGLNIKNSETERLIKELADLTGRTQTAAVTEAVRNEIKAVRASKRQKGALAADLMRIGREAAALMTEEERNWDYDAFLYDENGLPK
ncbi:MAG TPA: type II toxin-antitoxin system VapB family antitoxin [Rhizomicrobium sp.]|nr:type II toxin-antitoxin system VapB family antitoxin [Rhizomicrobium sp.]